MVLSLIKREQEGEWEPGLRWLRKVGIKCLEALAVNRSLPKTNPWKEKSWEGELAGMPSMKGGEYVDSEVMDRTAESFWQSIVKESGRHPGGFDGWLQSMGEAWELVGKVIFHLAELPAGGERPFGFLSTYADRVSAEGKPQHIPLARAMVKFKGDTASMESLLSPLRAASEKSLWLREAIASGKLFRAETMSVEETYVFLKAVPDLRESGLVTRMPADWGREGPSRVVVQVGLGEQLPQQEGSGGRPLWDFRADLALNGEVLTEEEWEKIRSSHSGLIFLRGKWIEVNADRVESLLKGWRQLKYLHGQGIPLSMAMRIIAGKVPEIVSGGSSSDEVEEWETVSTGEALQGILDELRKPGSLPEDELLRAELREYQKQGVSWMLALYRAGMGACLADDMGLGKTLQVIAFLSLLKKQGNTGSPSLIVAPASLISNWMAELAKFAPHLTCQVFHGERNLALGVGTDIVLTTYSYLYRREEELSRLWEVIVMDEAQNVKNSSTRQSQAAADLQANMKLALTGTPVENGLSDLWSIFNIINPGLLGKTLSSFTREFEKSKSEDSYKNLRTLISPFILRRMKSDSQVALRLPPKTVLTQRCYLSKKQAVLYAHLTESLRKELFSQDQTENKEERKGIGSPILKYILKFKQLCDHPSLLNGDNVFEPGEGGKFCRLGELASEWASRQEKVLVFTQFREMCIPIARFLETIYGEPGLIMHGETPLVQRRAGVDAFQSPGGPPFYVLSVKTAGTGLTLTAASHVVHFDRWWNPAVENQASDRAYRIGQDKPVFIHKFIVPGTLEEKIDRLISSKQKVADDLLQLEESWEKIIGEMKPEEVFELFVAG